MPDMIGPHLLGRRPSTPDPRDWKLSDPKKVQLALSMRQVPRQLPWWETFWQWVLSLFASPPVIPTPPAPPPIPPPTPPPPPPPPVITSMTWDDPLQLDQGDTPHCVGFGWAGWGDAAPVEDHFLNADGHAIYYECKIIDGEPDQENGSEVRSGAKVMQNRHRLAAYLFASTVDEVKDWLLHQGSVVIGTDWYDSMFDTDANGYVVPAGTVVGGHCYLCLGYDSQSDSFIFQNSWGTSWGRGGRFKMKASDFNALCFSGRGEACVGVELSL